MNTRFKLDLSLCADCGACSVACMDQNDRFPEKGQEPFLRHVEQITGTGADAKVSYQTAVCMHCDDAPCIEVCPVNCLWKDEETGLVLYENADCNNECIGCRKCLEVCPFEGPVFESDGKMVKCDGCVERIRAGLEPACVRICPFDALTYEK